MPLRSLDMSRRDIKNALRPGARKFAFETSPWAVTDTRQLDIFPFSKSLTSAQMKASNFSLTVTDSSLFLVGQP